VNEREETWREIKFSVRAGRTFVGYESRGGLSTVGRKSEEEKKVNSSSRADESFDSDDASRKRKGVQTCR